MKIELLAGYNKNGEAVFEQLDVLPIDNLQYQLEQSPGFVKGVAAGDVIKMAGTPLGSFSVVKRSGNLSIRVYKKSDIDVLDNELTPAVEKLDGSLDIKAARLLSYTIHVNIGFSVIENLFNSMTRSFTDCSWQYGNVYDPQTGQPLNWWDEFLSDQ